MISDKSWIFDFALNMDYAKWVSTLEFESLTRRLSLFRNWNIIIIKHTPIVEIL